MAFPRFHFGCSCAADSNSLAYSSALFNSAASNAAFARWDKAKNRSIPVGGVACTNSANISWSGGGIGGTWALIENRPRVVERSKANTKLTTKLCFTGASPGHYRSEERRVGEEGR